MIAAANPYGPRRAPTFLLAQRAKTRADTTAAPYRLEMKACLSLILSMSSIARPVINPTTNPRVIEVVREPHRYPIIYFES